MSLLDDMCRLCASIGERCVSIFSEEGDNQLLKHKLRVCSPVTVKPTDLFPKQICLECLSRLDGCYEFYQKAKKAQSQLQFALNDLQTKRKRSSSSDGNEESKRIRFGSTIIYLTEDQSRSNVMNGHNKEQTGAPIRYPPLYVIVDKCPKDEPETSPIKEKETPALGEKENPALGEKENPALGEKENPALGEKETPALGETETAAPKEEKTPSPKKTKSPLKKKKVSAAAAQNRSLTIAGNAKASKTGEASQERQISKEVSEASPVARSSVKSAQKKEALSKEKNIKKELPQSPLKKVRSVDSTSSTRSEVTKATPPPAPSVASTSEPSASEESKVSAVSKESNAPSTCDVPVTRDAPVTQSTPLRPLKKCQYCYKEISEEVLAQHESLHEGKNVFSCLQCSVSFFNQEAFDRHVRRHERST